MDWWPRSKDLGNGTRRWMAAMVLAVSAVLGGFTVADEPPTINPFGPRPAARSDGLPGVLELSDGSLHIGEIFLTRDAKLKIYDPKTKKFREVPLENVRRIECHVQKEWLEREWRFREAASNEKVYTGRTYPASIYEHTVTLRDGTSIRGPLSAPIYVREAESEKPRRFLLRKRDKGPIGTTLKALIYVRRIELGKKAVERARETRRPTSGSPVEPPKAEKRH